MKLVMNFVHDTEGQVDSTSPFREIAPDSGEQKLGGISLCPSGGGYRAMLFHLG
jgi:hypothetical protein